MPELKEECQNPQGVMWFIIWTIWNSIRFFIIGFLIFKANNKNANEIKRYNPDCCDCYFILQNASFYDVSGTRFDLSYCMPQCTDCRTCNDIFNASASDSFNYDGPKNDNNCPVRNATWNSYDDTKYKSWNWHLNKKAGCHSDAHISLTSFFVFSKSYTAYAKIALVSSSIYCAFNLLCILLTLWMADMCRIFCRWLWIYNIFMTELSLYLLFKPFQYYHQNFYVGANNREITCEVDSINDRMEKMLTGAIVISVAFVTFHFLWVIGWGIYYLLKCIKSYKRHHRGANVSVSSWSEAMSMQHTQNIQEAHDNYNALQENINTKKFTFLWACIGFIAFVVMIFFLVLVVISCVDMIEAVNREKWKKETIWTVSALLAFALFDNPWFLVKVIANSIRSIRKHCHK